MTAEQLVHDLGTVTTRSDGSSGHVWFAVESPDGRRLWVKTAGAPAATGHDLAHTERVAGLRRAAELEATIGEHPALIRRHGMVEASDGVALIYDWFDGEVIHPGSGATPAAAAARFRRLPAEEIAAALDPIIDLHVRIDDAGWVIGDFYDGNLMHDVDARRLVCIDFECYRRGSYRNEVGRLFGSQRFMAPEELTRGAMIDSRTTVFGLARMVDILLLAEHPLRRVRAVVDRATRSEPAQRYPSVRELQLAWRAAARELL